MLPPLDPSKRLPAPCVAACPAQIDIPRYIGYVERGEFGAAHAVVRESIPLPMLCGLICYRPCEPWCRRGIMEQAVAINAIKRAAAEHGPLDQTSRGWSLHPDSSGHPAQPTGKRVAVVGSGPAGLTAAYYLATCRGHQVTLIDAMSEMGGQLRAGLPEYKVRRDRLRREIEHIVRTRVDVRTGVRVDSLESLLAEHDAVLLAIGHGKAVGLGIEGQDLPGVGFASDFLRDVNFDSPWKVGRRVVILGGNNVAVDSARCAVRLGATEVLIVYPGPQAEAPAYDFELSAAAGEGVQFQEMAAPRRIEPTAGGLRIAMERLKALSTDDFGRSQVGPAGEAFALEADLLLVSAGQRADVPAAWGLELDARGFIKVELGTQATSRPRVFAAGDAVTGPDSIVEATAQGKKAAAAIDRFLGGDGDIAEAFAPPPGDEMAMPVHLAQQGKPAVPMPLLDAARRRTGFALVEQGYSREEARAEARRCIRCDLWRVGIPTVWSDQQG